MFELKSNEKIGAYLKELILSKYPSCRKFCAAYIDLTANSQDLRDDDIRRLENRLSQILKGKKSIQTYDLPIFSELLGVSCEQMLSAGAVCKPITSRRTNYSIAFSKEEQDWKEYLNREDRIAAYADEFGKTVVDYAIEFKNYGFIKFLIENDYITLISDDKSYCGINFGAKTTFPVRQYEAKTFEDELYENKILRTQIISLALENNDYKVLEEMRAREFPPQLMITYTSLSSVKLNDYYDDKFLETILCSEPHVIKYFCEEYYVKPFHRNEEVLWIFPFMGELISKAVKKNNSKAEILLDAAIKHNEETYNKLKKAILSVAQALKRDILKDNAFQDILTSVLRDYYRIDKENNVISFNSYYLIMESEKVMTNIVCVDAKSLKPEIQSKIEKLNELYSQIISIEDHLFKK